jgi:hypothetical protein
LVLSPLFWPKMRGSEEHRDYKKTHLPKNQGGNCVRIFSKFVWWTQQKIKISRQFKILWSSRFPLDSSLYLIISRPKTIYYGKINFKLKSFRNELRKGLDTMVMLKKPVQRNLPRYGSTSTISTQSSLDSNTSILSNTSSINDSAFKSASSKFTSMNSTMSSIMTNDKTYVSTNQSKTNNSLLKGYIAKQNVFKKQPNVIVTVTSSKTPKKNTFLSKRK